MATARKATAAAPRRAAGKRPAPVVVHPAAPSGRFAQLLAEVHVPDPYELTAQLRVLPPTWQQQQDVVACQGAFAVANNQLQDILTPKAVIQRDDEGKPILDDAGKQVVRYEIPQVDPSHIQRINEVVEASSARYNQALFGSAYGAVMEFFRDRPAAEWNAFYQDIQDQFLPLPEDGRCRTCGRTADEEQAGKPDASTAS